MTQSDHARDGTRPRIERHPLFDGLQIVDPIEGAQFSLLTPSSVSPAAGTSDDFYFPVDTTARIHPSAVETPYFVDVWIRDTDGNLRAQCAGQERASVPPGRYNVEVSSAKMKLYLAVDGPVTVEPRDDRTQLSFSETRAVTVGVRSLHERPAATVTTTDDPVDLMRAISTFGSALKTPTCERSFPTLRGHPPLLERGAELSIPAAISEPDTGIRIEVPPELSAVYPVAPLSYYLGATVRPGSDPRLLADGESFSLTADGDIESTVPRVLKQVFLLDCVTRTEGYYTVDLRERDVVEEQVDFDFEALYDRPPAEQVRRYLSASYDDLRPAIPRWKLTADVVPDPEHLGTLPFLANELAVIRCPDCEEIDARTIDMAEATVADFFGDPGGTSRGGQTLACPSPERTTRGGSPRTESDGNGTTFDEHVFRPLPTDSIEQTYVGDGIPLGASKMSTEAYRRRLEYQPTDDTQTSVVVVCNDAEMEDENAVSDIYGTREWLEFDITIREHLTTEEMAEVLRTDADFLHYIGHVDADGIRCADGWLDTHSLESVGVSAFLLNACKSYEQGRGLVDGGALGGIVTVTDVLDRTAARLGRTIAKLIDNGFSLLSGLRVLERKSITASQYLVVGDGSATVVESQTGTPHSNDIEHLRDDRYRLSIRGFPSKTYGLGSLYTPYFDDEQKQYLNSTRLIDKQRSIGELLHFLSMGTTPVEFGGSLYWSDEVDESVFKDRQ